MSSDTYIPALGRHLTNLELLQIQTVRLVNRLASLNANGVHDLILAEEVDTALAELEEAERAHGIGHPEETRH